jgi:hypothetical protein
MEDPLGLLYSQQHLLIINFPGESCLRELIHTLQQNDPDTFIVVLSQEALPRSLESAKVECVQGTVTTPETYIKHGLLTHAKKVLVLRYAEDPIISDSVVAAIIRVLKTLKPSLSVSGECLLTAHAPLLQQSGADEVVHSESIIRHLLAQSVMDSGISFLLEQLTKREIKYNLFRTPLGKLHHPYCTYPLLAKRLIDKGYTLVAFRRDLEIHFKLHGHTLKLGDDIFYVGSHRLNWIEIKDPCHAP